MAADEEHQGLKIAVAALVTATVILSVTTYFSFSSSSLASARLQIADARLKAAQDQVARSLQEVDQLRQDLDDLERTAGSSPAEGAAYKAAVAKHLTRLHERVDDLKRTLSSR